MLLKVTHVEFLTRPHTKANLKIQLGDDRYYKGVGVNLRLERNEMLFVFVVHFTRDDVGDVHH